MPLVTVGTPRSNGKPAAPLQPLPKLIATFN
jgi:hypothetical protein